MNSRRKLRVNPGHALFPVASQSKPVGNVGLKDVAKKQRCGIPQSVLLLKINRLREGVGELFAGKPAFSRTVELN